MLFLLNDVVIEIEEGALIPASQSRRFEALSATFVERLGRELYSEEPLLHRNAPERARRLATLIAARSPEINAALFEAPARGCAPDSVSVRLTTVDPRALAALADGKPDPRTSDRAVWSRLAA